MNEQTNGKIAVGAVAPKMATPAAQAPTAGAPKMEERQVRTILERNVREMGKAIKRPAACVGNITVSELNGKWAMLERGGELMAIPRETLDRELEGVWKRHF
jgi:hypothetical protein